MVILKDRRGVSKDRIVEDIRRNIREGILKPGDKLLSIRELIDRYDVSQWVVKDAFTELEKLNLIETRERSGSYIKGGIEKIDIPESGPQTDASRTYEDLDPDYFLTPRKRVKDLTLYVSDSYESSRTLWKEVLDDFMLRHPGVNIRMLGCQDGHVQELMKDRQIDILHTSLSIFKDIGDDNFIPVRDLENVGVRNEDLLPPLRKHVQSSTGELSFVPFSLAMRFLYVNNDMLSRSKILRIPESLDEMTSVALDFERNYCREGEYGMIHSELSNQLFINGILSNDGKGCVKLDTGKATDLLRNLEKYPLRFMQDSESYPQAIRQNTDRLFVAGRLLLYPRHSFFTQLLEEKKIGGWKVALHPSVEGAPFGSDLSVLAMDKNNPCQHESLILLEYLCSKEVQEKFSRLHGNFAIYSKLYDSRAKLKDHPIQYEVIHETLEKSYRQWSTVNVCKEIKDAVEACGYRFFTRQASAEETLRRLALIVEVDGRSRIKK